MGRCQQWPLTFHWGVTKQVSASSKCLSKCSRPDYRTRKWVGKRNQRLPSTCHKSLPQDIVGPSSSVRLRGPPKTSQDPLRQIHSDELFTWKWMARALSCQGSHGTSSGSCHPLPHVFVRLRPGFPNGHRPNCGSSPLTPLGAQVHTERGKRDGPPEPEMAGG